MRKEGITAPLELYSRDVFQVLLEYELNRVRRYPASLTLLNIQVKIEPNRPEVLAGAERAITGIFNTHLRGADIPSKSGNEYLILLPTTDENGGRIVCERLLSLFKKQFQTETGNMFSLTAYIGMACLEGGSSVSGAMLTSQATRALANARAQGLSTYSVFVKSNEKE